MKVWILQTGEPLHSDGSSVRPMRAMNLANKLIERGHQVTLWSSAFYHQEKRHRSHEFVTIHSSELLSIKLIPSKGYIKNIGIGRLIDHAQLAFNLKSILKNNDIELPEIAFIGYPPIEAAYVLSFWLKKHEIPFLLDVKDLWPSMFLDAVPRYFRPFVRVVLEPYFYMAKKTMSRATGITTMAPPFMDWVLSFTGRDKNKYDGIFPLTSPPANYVSTELESTGEWWAGMGVSKTNHGIRIMFVGSFMSVFDFMPIKNAAITAIEANVDIQFVLCGSGGSFNETKKLFVGINNVLLPGWIDRPKIETLAKMSDASIAPYLNIDNYIVNTPNKIVDALSLGLPILSPLSGEVERLINDYEVGITYGTCPTLYEVIVKIRDNKELQRKMSINALSLFNDKFSFEKVYGGLVSHLESMSKVKRS